MSCSVAPPGTGFDWNWVEVRLEAKTEMCVPYGTEATVYGSQIGKHPLDRETFLSKKQETNKKPQLPGDESMHLYRDVFSVLSRSCRIMEMCSGKVTGHGLWIVHNSRQTLK